MGNAYEYYRAADRAAAVIMPEYPRAVDDPPPGRPVFDAVETKWISPWEALAQLVALVRDVPSADDLVRTVVLYPPPEGAPQTDEEWGALPEDSPYFIGPGIEELPADVRDTLAGVPDERLVELGEWWAEGDEESMFGAEPAQLAELIGELRGLARRARDEGQLLYCWSCL
ncbi:hypothetical protein [Nonomuraea fuscirosea]|uniref:hypothetical protein n=1 Tax=Nonomuraea fuscirosea TaxID=1291556 RepID=UPI0033CF07BB